MSPPPRPSPTIHERYHHIPIARRKSMLEQYRNNVANGESIACPDGGWSTDSVLVLADALASIAAEKSEKKIVHELCPYEIICCFNTTCWYAGVILKPIDGLTGLFPEYGFACAPLGQKLQPLAGLCEIPDCTVPKIPITTGGRAVFKAGTLPSAEIRISYGPNVTQHQERVLSYEDSNVRYKHFAIVSKAETRRTKMASETAYVGFKVAKSDGAENAILKATDGNHQLVEHDGVTYDVVIS